MARKAKSENGGDQTAGQGHNSEMTDQDRQALTYENRRLYERALNTKKAADADFKKVCRNIKAELGSDGLKDIKAIIELSTPEGEERFQTEIERRMRVARWMGLPFGTQSDLFSGTDMTPLVDRARAEGKRAGLAGEAASPPHDMSTSAGQAWLAGHGEGQSARNEALLRRNMKTLPTDGDGETDADDAGDEEAEDNRPHDSVPREQWAQELAAQNQDAEAEIKATAARLGSEPATYTRQ